MINRPCEPSKLNSSPFHSALSSRTRVLFLPQGLQMFLYWQTFFIVRHCKCTVNNRSLISILLLSDFIYKAMCNVSSLLTRGFFLIGWLQVWNNIWFNLFHCVLWCSSFCPNCSYLKNLTHYLAWRDLPSFLFICLSFSNLVKTLPQGGGGVFKLKGCCRAFEYEHECVL